MSFLRYPDRNVLGHQANHAIHWVAKNGWTLREVRSVFKLLKLDYSPSFIAACVRHHSIPGRVMASFSADQIAFLVKLRAEAQAEHLAEDAAREANRKSRKKRSR